MQSANGIVRQLFCEWLYNSVEDKELVEPTEKRRFCLQVQLSRTQWDQDT